MTDEDNNMLSLPTHRLFVNNAAVVDNNEMPKAGTGNSAAAYFSSRQYLFFFGGRPAHRYDPFRATPCITARPRDTIGRPDRTVACK